MRVNQMFDKNLNLEILVCNILFKNTMSFSENYLIFIKIVYIVGEVPNVLILTKFPCCRFKYDFVTDVFSQSITNQYFNKFVWS